MGAAGSWIDMVSGNKHPFHQVKVQVIYIISSISFSSVVVEHSGN